MVNEGADNLNQIFLVALAAHAEEVCFRVKRGAQFRPVRYRHLESDALRVALYLDHLEIGDGERVAILAENSPEWMASYIGCLLAGAVAVPLRLSTPAEELRFVLRDSGARIAIVEGPEQLRFLDDSTSSLPALGAVLLLAGRSESTLPCQRFADLRAHSLSTEESTRLRRRAEAVAPEAQASIQYTARETGQPKGAVFDHRRRLEALRRLGEWVHTTPEDVAFSVLPWGYSPSLLFSLRCLISGVPNVLAESREKAFENMRQSSPTLALVTPYGLERFYNQVMSQLDELPESRRDIFRWALSLGREARAAGATGPAELREEYARVDRTFFSQIRAELGGRLRRVYSVGAPLPPHVGEFGEAIGLEPQSLYGLTEAGGFPAMQRPGNRCEGACGQVGKGFQIRIADDGEVLVRGDTVMREYWRQPEATREILEPDGWLRTGDLGRFDQEGNLFLTGHKRSLFILSTGRTITPTLIENALVASPLVAHAIAVGEGRPFVTALAVPDLTAVASRLQSDGVNLDGDELDASHERVGQLIEEVRQEVNSGLDTWERIERITLLADSLSEAGGEVKASMTLNREVVAERFAAQIDAMYPRYDRFRREQVTRVQMAPEQLRELFEKQDILDAWMADAGISFLFDIARAQDIHAPSMVHISETAAAIAQMQSEERPLSTALIVGDPARIARTLPESEVQLQRYDHIRRMRRVVITLAEMVDGLVLGFVLDQHGYLRGIHKLEVELDREPNLLLGPQFAHHAAISRQCGAMVFFVPNGGRQVRVFSGGALVGRYAGGAWSSESVERLEESLQKLAEDGQDMDLVRRLLRCAFRMSEENLGAIFLVGDANAVLEVSDPPAVGTFATITGTPLSRLSNSELINFAKQDGATIIDGDGYFRGCKVLLRPAAETRAEIGPDKGARHSSAAKMSAETQCLAITVSQDGPITAYQNGRRVFSL